MNRSFERAVVEVIGKLLPGEVASYGEIAQEAGFPGAARAVGLVLARTEAPIPWWRVVRADGTLVSPNAKKQALLLRGEGVRVRAGKVVGS